MTIMPVETPGFKRCCFCLPLRAGLLAWGYIKIIAYLLFIPFMVYYLVMVTLLISMFVGIQNAIHMTEIVIQFVLAITTLVCLVTDLVATFLFIVAGHKKNVKLLRVFYFYSIAMFIVTALLATTIVCLIIGYWISTNAAPSSFDTMLIICSTYFVVLVQQTYFLLLLRSEIIKLRIVGEFRFVNNAAEAECTMKSPEIVEGEENKMEDD